MLKAIKPKKGKKGKFLFPVINTFTKGNHCINKVSGVRILHTIDKIAKKFTGQILLPETIPKKSRKYFASELFYYSFKF